MQEEETRKKANEEVGLETNSKRMRVQDEPVSKEEQLIKRCRDRPDLATLLLVTVAEKGRDEDVEFCVKELNADVNYCYSPRKTALICAIAEGHRSTTRLLLKLGADANFCTPARETALRMAILQFDMIAIKLLLDHGAAIHEDHLDIAESRHPNIHGFLVCTQLYRTFTTVIVSGLLEPSSAASSSSTFTSSKKERTMGIKEFLTEGVCDARLLIYIEKFATGCLHLFRDALSVLEFQRSTKSYF